MQVIYAKTAKKRFRRLPATDAERFFGAFDKLAEDPSRKDLDITTLKGKPGYRLRIGNWRALFVITDNIEVYDVGPRGDIYK